MVQQDWSKLVQDAMEHLEKGNRVYSAVDSLTVIDDVADGLSPNAIATKNGFVSDLISTAMGHVTTAVHGPGKVPRLVDGGWYERQNDAYVVAPGFASAWKKSRLS